MSIPPEASGGCDNSKNFMASTSSSRSGSITHQQPPISFPMQPSVGSSSQTRAGHYSGSRSSSNTPGAAGVSFSSWTEPPPIKPPSPIKISEWIPNYLEVDNHRSQRSKNSGQPVASTSTSTGTSRPDFVKIEFVDPAHETFVKLCKLFPKAPKHEVERLVNLYEGELEWCAEALLHRGHELEDVVETDQASYESPRSLSSCYSSEENPGIMCGAVERFASSPKVNNMKKNIYSDSGAAVLGHNPTSRQRSLEDVAGSSSSSSTGEDEAGYFEMVLPADFAKGLVTEFGHPDDEPRELSQDELKIKVPPDIAFELYKSLYLNMHRTETEGAAVGMAEPEAVELNSSPRPTSLLEDGYDEELDDLAIRISQIQMELEALSGNPNLSSIMSIESKISSHMQESLEKYSSPNRTMAQKLNFCSLKQTYAHLEDRIIDEIYCQCHLDKEKTVEFLDEMYGQPVLSVEQPLPSTSAEVFCNDREWELKYNPKDVKLYSIEELKSVTEEKEKHWISEMSKMKRYYQKCKNENNPSIKSFYASEANKLSVSMMRLSEELQYYKAISQNAKHRNDQTLDLHGLNVKGAMRVLKEFLQFNEEEFLNCGLPKMFLLIITGQGKHSKNGCPVLQPAVKTYLAQNKYNYQSKTLGSYTVTLTRGNVARKK